MNTKTTREKRAEASHPEIDQAAYFVSSYLKVSYARRKDGEEYGIRDEMLDYSGDVNKETPQFNCVSSSHPWLMSSAPLAPVLHYD